MIAVTLNSPFLMGQQVGRQMVAQGTGGKIVNVGSTSGFFGRSRAIAYSAAKGGVVNLTRAMAVQLAPHRIRVNAIVPNKIGSPVGKDEFDPTRPVPNLAAARRAGRRGERRAVPGDRGFVLRRRHHAVCRRRRLGDGFVLSFRLSRCGRGVFRHNHQSLLP